MMKTKVAKKWSNVGENSTLEDKAGHKRYAVLCHRVQHL